MKSNPPHALCIAGPTASGKTALALALAQQLPIEIISVDSALIYRGMDIGTAKPTADELASVPHHLIDTLDPSESYSTGKFCNDAVRLVKEIRQRGKLPVLAGGTMLYFKALLEGINDIPRANPVIRAEIEAIANEHGWPHVHRLLAEVDPATAARLAPNDQQRLERALEVYKLTGKPLSHFHQQEKTPFLTDALLIALEPPERSWLHQRIAQRTRIMLDSGLVEEVRALKTRSDLDLTMPSMRCVGYRQTWEALEQEKLEGVFPASDLEERITIATRQLAKRQMTWLRSMPQRVPLNASLDVEAQLSAILPLIKT